MRPEPVDIEVTYIRSKELPAARQPEASVKRSEPLPEISEPKKLISTETPRAVQAGKSESEEPKKEPAKSPPAKKLVGEQPSKIVIKEPVIPTIERAAIGASVDVQGLRLIPPSYSQVVRDRIIENLDTRRAGGEGDVYVRFVITSSGALKEINIIDERSTDNGVLRGAAFEAVKNSAPFPAFPEKVPVPEIAFTCDISFTRR